MAFSEIVAPCKHEPAPNTTVYPTATPSAHRPGQAGPLSPHLALYRPDEPSDQPRPAKKRRMMQEGEVDEDPVCRE